MSGSSVTLSSYHSLPQARSYFLPMSNPKTFVAKGVQTDSFDYVPASKSKKNLYVSPQRNTLLDRSASQSSDTSSALCSLDDLEVYTYPHTPFPDCPRHISDCPPTTPRRVRNYGQLGSIKPSHMVSTDRRIASLPETSPPYRISQTQGTVRLASMPEQLMALRSKGDSKQYLDYTETLKLSPDSNPRSGSFDIGHTVLSGVLRTPSPPGSPESVVIVGDDDNDPRPFLHRRSRAGIETNGGMYEHIRRIYALNGYLFRMDYPGRLTAQTYSCTTWPTLVTICEVPFVRQPIYDTRYR